MSFPCAVQEYVRSTTRLVRNVWVRGVDQAQLPVIVYQMGKVGSTSLTHSLDQHGVWPVHQVHRLDPSHLEEIKRHRTDRGLDNTFPDVHKRGLQVYREIVEPRQSAKLISLVRNPVDRNVSAFFYNFVDVEEQYEDCSASELIPPFLEAYSHDVPLTWFQREPEVTLGIDVYDTPFPHGRGYIKLQNGPFELLVLRTELPDNKKAEAVQRFLGLTEFQIQRRNTGQNKEYAETYDSFKQRITLPDSYLDRMLQSQYAQHFYSAEEIERTYDRWS